MNRLYFLFFLLCTFFLADTIQAQEISREFEPSSEAQFGKLNPNAPSELADFKEMIGRCICESIRRNPDQTWQDPLQMIWEFKYILNGTAVQDEVWRENELYATSIRQYHPDSARWVVSYFSYPSISTSPGVWQGNRTDDKIILRMPQKAPNGMDGFSQLSFYDISEDGFKWKGEWMDGSGTIIYPFWKIKCRKSNE